MSKPRLRAAVLGATGVAGQQFLVALHGHPQFELTRLGASARSAGRPYLEAIRDSGHTRWYCREPLPAEFAGLPVEDAAEMSADGLDVVFAAVESDAARVLEPRFAEKVPVFSTASAFRYEPDVPVLIPGVNPAHSALVDVQRRRRGWKGFIVPGPNCTTTGLAITLAPLAEAFGIERVLMTSMQSVSGGGRSPGVAALDIVDNVIPYIAKEEEKVEKEARKILGAIAGDGIAPAAFGVSCTCTRVNVLDGHTEAVYVALGKPAAVADAARVMREWAPLPAGRYFSAPPRLIEVHDDPYRPQPRLDRDAGEGMTTSVGRLREESMLGGAGGVKYVLVSHNTRMGAAKGMTLCAEILLEEGRFG